MVILVIGGCAASIAPPIPTIRPGPTPGGTRPGSAVSNRLYQVVPDEAEGDDQVGDAEQQPDPAGAADVGLRGGKPERADVWRERGGEREQRHDGDEAEEQAVAAGDAETEVEVPRQEQRETSRATATPSRTVLMPGGHVADAGRPGYGGRDRNAGRSRDDFLSES
jgi:hypothetical protein